MKKEKYTFALRTNDNGFIEESRHPQSSKEQVTAMLMIASWGQRKTEDIIPEPKYLEMHEATQAFIRACMKYRAACMPKATVKPSIKTERSAVSR